MSERENRLRAVLLTYFPMFIAALSLATSIFNGYLNSRFLDFIEHNTSRTEYLRTCRDIIDAYFQVKFRAGVISANAGKAAEETLGRDETEALNAVNHFAALGTYLANLRDDRVREQYTHLSEAVERAVRQARHTPAPEVDKLFAAADTIFTGMNDDCVKSARNAPM